MAKNISYFFFILLLQLRSFLSQSSQEITNNFLQNQIPPDYFVGLTLRGHFWTNILNLILQNPHNG